MAARAVLTGALGLFHNMFVLGGPQIGARPPVLARFAWLPYWCASVGTPECFVAFVPLHVVRGLSFEGSGPQIPLPVVGLAVPHREVPERHAAATW